MMGMVSGMVLAQEFDARGDSTKELRMPQIEILTQRDRVLSRVPGSVTVVDFRSIQKIAPIHGNELFRKIPGLNVVDEEGAGLRINIGVRGLDPDRSRNVLVLEDGIPVALNPYGEPELYFTPPIDKMTAVEVLKGSGQILFGPQTTGGVVNLISANPPEKESSTLRLKAGTGGFISTYASYGNKIDKIRFLVSYLNKRADKIGTTRFNLHDIAAKMSIALSEKAKIGIKLGLYDEMSNSTYIGLTQTMYDKGGQDYLRMAPNDLLPVRRYHFSATHQYKLSSQWQWHNTVFGYTTTRNWRRQDFSTSAAANRTGIVWGDPTVPGGALYMLKTNGHRNRQFDVAAIESQLKWRTTKQLLQVGIRLLAERANEQFLIGGKPDAVGGTLRDVEQRKGKAISLYIHDKIAITKKLEVNVGVRVENFDYSRNILRGRFMVNGATTIADTNVVASNKLMAIIPGWGFNYSLDEGVTLFGGIHRGFAPPRTKDAITPEGMALDISQEDSWNSELGLRALLGKDFKAELTFFSMDFNNQIIPVSQSSGNANATGLANGGETRHFGIEAGASFDLAKQMKKNFSLVFAANVTWIDSRFSANRFIIVGASKVNVKNNQLPYAPSLMLNHSIEFESTKGAGIRLSGNYVGMQFADELNTVAASADGRNGLLASRYITDLSAFARLSQKQILFSFAVKNLTNERYIASRRPQGIRVGIDRQVVLGMEVKW